MSVSNRLSKKKNKKVSYTKWGYIFLLPFFLVYCVFSLIPMLSTFYYSFFENYMSGLKTIGPTFVGFDNFVKLFTEADLLKYFENTIIMWILGRPSKVTASIHTVTARYGAECGESGEAMLEFPSGAVATFAAGWVDRSNPMMCEISGTKAHAAIVFDKFYFSNDERTYPVNREPVEDVMENLPHAFQLFLDKVNGKDVALVDVFEAADRNIVMEAAYKSSAEGVRLNIEY